MAVQRGQPGNPATNILLTGVGGQGTLLAADIIALVGMELGLDVKKSEIHGMAQRGGSVVSQVRWGPKVHSPIIGRGEADIMVAFERLEGLRYADQLRPGGVLLVNDYRIAPISVTAGDDVYPSAEQERAAYGDHLRVRLVPAMRIAQELGQVRVSNVVLLGALSTELHVDPAIWLRTIARRVPERYLALNQAAFRAGRAYVEG
ncbi:MAG: indolepyruvate oxidoreductase subunit beta [Chloroflexi bacterium]|nr:indolepyruvate oxidoreductase subunit beta [Chloroflexota bacterium]